MEREDFLEGVFSIVESHNGLKALKKVGNDALLKQTDVLLSSEVLSEAGQRRHIMEKMRFEGMKAMLNCILEELNRVGKSRD